MSKNDALGARIKKYERAYDQYLTPNSKVFIRVDGKAFHTWARHAEKPFDPWLADSMNKAALECSKNMQGFRLAYGQSDEYTFMLSDTQSNESEGWFDYRLNKLVSITASMFTAYFNQAMLVQEYQKPALFDARAFVVPEEDAPNVFVWRQKDWYRNSIQMFAQNLFSSKQLHGKKLPEVLDMCLEKGYDWNEVAPIFKYGTFITTDEFMVHEYMNYNEIREEIEEENVQ